MRSRRAACRSVASSFGSPRIPHRAKQLGCRFKIDRSLLGRRWPGPKRANSIVCLAAHAVEIERRDRSAGDELDSLRSKCRLEASDFKVPPIEIHGPSSFVLEVGQDVRADFVGQAKGSPEIGEAAQVLDLRIALPFRLAVGVGARVMVSRVGLRSAVLSRRLASAPPPGDPARM